MALQWHIYTSQFIVLRLLKSCYIYQLDFCMAVASGRAGWVLAQPLSQTKRAHAHLNTCEVVSRTPRPLPHCRNYNFF